MSYESVCRRCSLCIRYRNSSCEGLIRYDRLYCPIQGHKKGFSTMKHMTALILVFAAVLGLCSTAYGYPADFDGRKEAVPAIHAGVVEAAFDSTIQHMYMEELDEPDEPDSLTTAEKIAINHDPNDPRWFDIEDCTHQSTTIWPCWSPDDGSTWQEECDDCGEILAEWPREEDEEDEEEEECSHTSLVQYQSGSVFTVECADCGEILNEWTQELEEVDYSMDDSEELGACDDDEEVSEE